MVKLSAGQLRERILSEVAGTDLPAGMVALWSLGNVGFLIKGAARDGLLAIDPYLSDAIQAADPTTEFVRAFPPPLAPGDLGQARAVLISHEHDDHLDPATLAALVPLGVELVVPGALAASLADRFPRARLLKAKTGVPLELGRLRIWPLRAEHPEYREDPSGYPYQLGYGIEVNGVRIYHSGDTRLSDALLESVAAFGPDVVMLPINGGDYFRERRGIAGNLSFREAADLAWELGAALVVPLHYDLFPNNRDRPAHFVDYLLEQYPEQAFHMFAAGERYLYAKAGQTAWLPPA